MEGQLLKIHYERVVGTEEITLTPTNCSQYGYTYKTIDDSSLGSVTVYYKIGDSEENFISYDELGNTTILNEIKKEYTHIAPPCSSYQWSFDDVDKEGSGRNDLTGEMYRERVGSYNMLELSWDLIPKTKEYNNWYKILTHLPSNFYADLLTPSGEIETKQFYRSMVSTNLYLFTKEHQIWQGLSTSFIQWNVDPYDDTVEPTLES